jgi:uncharacterized protein (DUF58 family)
MGTERAKIAAGRGTGDGPGDVATLMREVRRLEIRARRRVDDLLGGEYHSAFRGRGIEFAEVREYQPGDEVRLIDWNVTARAGRPFVKRFVEERQLTVFLVVDASASMRFGTRGKTKARAAAEAGAMIALASARNNDRCGLMLFGDTHTHVPASKGRGHSLRIVRELLAAERGAGPDAGGRERSDGPRTLAEALREADRHLAQRAIVVVITDLVPALGEPAPANAPPPWARALGMLARRHEVVVIAVEDAAEHALPALGLVEFMDAETGQAVRMDLSRGAARRMAAAAAEARRRNDRAIGLSGAEVLRVHPHEPIADALHRFFTARAGVKRAAR